MGDNVQVVSLSEEQRVAAERQRQALEAARLAAEAQVQREQERLQREQERLQREQEEQRRREEEQQRQRNLAAQRAAQVSRIAWLLCIRSCIPFVQLLYMFALLLC